MLPILERLPRSRRSGILVGAAVLVLALVTLALRSPNHTKYITAPVTRGAVDATVEATGTINPLTTVPVGSYVSGTVKYIFADFNTHVHAGDVLAQIDPDVYAARVVEARGNLQKSEANLRNAQAALRVIDATIESETANAAKAEADLAYARANAQRIANLQKEGLAPLDQKQLSDSTRMQAEATAHAAHARAAEVRAERSQMEAQVDQARADVVAMTGALQEAESNLRYTTILSPTDGVVVARNIAVGQSVAASLQAPNLFTIAQDLQRMQVYAKTDESDTGFIRVGADATFQVDAFPTEVFHGRVSAIRLNAYTVSNVVTYDTVIDFDNTEGKLLPGETAFVTVSTGRAANAVLVPNSAVSFTPDLPSDGLQRLYEKFSIPKPAYTTHRDNQQVVWRLSNGDKLEPVAIHAGLSDSSVTQVLSGAVKLGDQLVTSAMTSGGGSQQAKGPFPQSGRRR